MHSFDLALLPNFNSVFGANLGASTKSLTYTIPYDYSAELALSTLTSHVEYTSMCLDQTLSSQIIDIRSTPSYNPGQTVSLTITTSASNVWSCFGGYIIILNPDMRIFFFLIKFEAYYQIDVKISLPPNYSYNNPQSKTETSTLKYNPLFCVPSYYLGLAQVTLATSGINTIGASNLQFTLDANNKIASSYALSTVGNTKVSSIKFLLLTFSESKNGCRATIDAQINGADSTQIQNINLVVRATIATQYIALITNKFTLVQNSSLISSSSDSLLPSFLTASLFTLPSASRTVDAGINPFPVSYSDELNYNFLSLEPDKWNQNGFLITYHQFFSVQGISEIARSPSVSYGSAPGLTRSMESYATIMISRTYKVTLSVSSSCQFSLSYSGLLRSVFVNSHFMLAESSKDPASTTSATSDFVFKRLAPSDILILQITGRLIQISSVSIICKDSSNNPVTVTMNPYAIVDVESPPVSVLYPSTTSCSSNCLTCREATVCLSCSKNYYLLDGLCFIICPSTSPYVSKRKYCQTFVSNQFTRASSTTFNPAASTVKVDFIIDPFESLDGFAIIFTPYSIRISNTPLIYSNMGSSLTLSEASVVLAQTTLTNQSFEISSTVKVYPVSNIAGTYPLNIYIYSLEASNFLITKFSSLANLFADGVEYISDLSAYYFYTNIFYKIQFILDCIDLCYLKLELLGNALITKDQLTLIFEAQSSIKLKYQVTTSFRKQTLVTVELFNSNFFSLSFTGNYRIYSLQDYYGKDDSLSITMGSCYVPGCENCRSNSLCLSCQSGYFLTADRQNCIIDCPLTELSSAYERRCRCSSNRDCSLSKPICNTQNGICLSCDSSCSMCEEFPPSYCVTCASSYYKHQSIEGKCVQVCDSGYYGDPSTKSCEPCHEYCYSCNGPTNEVCLSCQSSAWSLGSSTCVLSCPSNYFASLAQKKCFPCETTCLTCFGPNSNNCLSCRQSEYYPSNGECLACNSACAACFGPTNKECTLCSVGYFKINGICTAINCQEGFYGDSKTGKCIACSIECKTCKDSTSCLTCADRYFMQNNKCKYCVGLQGFELRDNTCQEICGDGLNYGFNQCDDGNNLNGDGCSTSCVIESGWKCSGGSRSSRDSCILQTAISAFTSNSPHSQLLTLYFSSPVFPQASWNRILRVFIQPGLEEITDFSVNALNASHYVFDFSKYTARINITLDIIIQNQQPALLLDEQSRPVFFKVYSQIHIPEEVSSDDEIASTFSNVYFGVTFATLMISGAVKVLIGNLNILQLVHYLYFVSVDYPKLIETIFDLSEFGGLNILPNILAKTIQFSEETLGKGPSKFEKEEISPFFLASCGGILNSWMLAFLIKYVCSGLTYLMKKDELSIDYTIERNRRIKSRSFSHSLHEYFNTMEPSQYIIGFYYPLAMGVYLQLAFWNATSVLNIAIDILGVLVLFALAMCPYFVYKMLKHQSSNQNLQRRREIFILDYSNQTRWKRCFLCFELVEKNLFMLFLVLCWKYPSIQLFGIAGSKIIIMTLLVVIKPYKIRNDLYARLFIEVMMILSIFSIFFMYQTDNNEFFVYLTAFCFITMIGISMIRVGFYQLKIILNEFKVLLKGRGGSRRVRSNLLTIKRKSRPRVLKKLYR